MVKQTYITEEEQRKCRKVADAFRELEDVDVVVVDAGRYGFVKLQYYTPQKGFENDYTFTESIGLFEDLWEEWLHTQLIMLAKEMGIWDNPEDDLIPYFQKFLEHTTVKDKRKRRVYVLTNYGSTHEQDLYRIYALRDMGYDPYVMIYEKPTAPEKTKKMQRWVNNKWLFHSVKDFKDYVPSGYKNRKETAAL